jgi:UDP-2,4-diacetamido-2,4,6-trideoxy-beta-L-altropyranose hydrolase
MQHAVFRANATPPLGGGHVYRCLTLAHALAAEGWVCSFACNRGAGRVVSWLDRSPFRRIDPDVLGGEPVDLLVIDDYDLEASYESACRSWAKQILVIDDLANRKHDADLLLDQNIGRQASDYAALVPPSCRLLIGPAFALLRPEFAAARPASLDRRCKDTTVDRIFVGMGLTDPLNATGRALEAALAVTERCRIDVMLGASAPYLDAVRRQAAKAGPRVAVHVDVPGPWLLMSEADLAIGAAGTSTAERCCLGLPSIVLVTANNQMAQATILCRDGLAVVTDDEPNTIRLALRRLNENALLRYQVSRRSAAACDGVGAKRLVAQLDALTSGQSR